MRFVRALKEKKGFVIKPVQEDGACLFRAICKYQEKSILFIFFFVSQLIKYSVMKKCMQPFDKIVWIIL